MLDKYKQYFSELRWQELCELVSTKGMKVTSSDFTTSEIDLIIEETPLSDELKKGAKLYYMHKVKMNNIAYRLGYSDSTIKYYKKRVSLALRTTCCRIFK